MEHPEAMRAEQQSGWRQAFTLFSLGRYWPLFETLGLPLAMSAHPQFLSERARHYLEATLPWPPGLRTASVSANPDQRPLQETFAQLAVDYGAAEAAALRTWSVQFIVDRQSVMRLAVWSELLRRLCGLMTPDEFSVAPSLDDAMLHQVCTVAQRYMTSPMSPELTQRLAAARAKPLDNWEERLEAQVRYEAGEGPILGVVEAMHDLVSLTLSYRAVSLAWDDLRRQLSDAHQAQLLAWGRQQAAVLGWPGPDEPRVQEE